MHVWYKRETYIELCLFPIRSNAEKSGRHLRQKSFIQLFKGGEGGEFIWRLNNSSTSCYSNCV